MVSPCVRRRRQGRGATRRAAYALLLAADRSLFAWEWLRRDPDYRAAWARSSTGRTWGVDPAAAQFGLAAFEPPDRAVPYARPMWLASADRGVIEAAPDIAGTEAFSLEMVAGQATVLGCEKREHLLLSDGPHQVRLDAPPGTFTSGPVPLRYTIRGIARAEPQLLTLKRFLALCRTGRFAASLHRRETRAPRWIMMLRAFDGLAAGAGQREIARRLLQPNGAGPRWRSEDPSLRSRVQRLVRSARAAAAGGYRRLLD